MGVIKIKKTILFGLLMFLLLATTALAASFNTDKVSINVDYSDFNDNDDEYITVTTGTFTVSRTANGTGEELVNIYVTNLPAGYSVVGGSKQVTILAGATTADVPPFQINVPHNKGSGKDVEIGTLTINSQATSTKLYQNTLSMLELSDFKIDYISQDGNSERETFDENDEEFKLDQSVRVGTEVTLYFGISNLFDEGYDDDGEIENIELTIEVDDDDLFAEDFDEDYDFVDLGADESDSLELTFLIDEETDAKEYIFDITLQGEDGKSATHKVERTLELDIERDRDDIRILRAELKPSDKITTCDSTFSLELELKNYGTTDQKYVAYGIYNAQLDLNEKNSEDIVIEAYDENDNTWSKTFTFDLPEGIVQGTFPIDVNIFIDRDENADYERLNLVVENGGSCGVVEPQEGQTTSGEEEQTSGEEQPQEEDQTQETTATGEEETTETGGQISSSTVVTTIENPYTTEDLLLGVLIVAIILILALVIFLFVVLLK